MNYQVYTNVGKIVQNLRNKIGPYNDKDTENTTVHTMVLIVELTF